jgi:hypothetical protein
MTRLTAILAVLAAALGGTAAYAQTHHSHAAKQRPSAVRPASQHTNAWAAAAATASDDPSQDVQNQPEPGDDNGQDMQGQQEPGDDNGQQGPGEDGGPGPSQNQGPGNQSGDDGQDNGSGGQDGGSGGNGDNGSDG